MLMCNLIWVNQKPRHGKGSHTVIVDQGFDVAHNLNISIVRALGQMSKTAAVFLVHGSWLRVEYERNSEQTLTGSARFSSI